MVQGLIIAFEKAESRRRIRDMLEGGGISVYADCRSGAEVIRAAAKIGGGIVISGYKLSDMTALSLSYSLVPGSLLLLVAPSHQLDCCSGEDIFTLPAPISRGDLLASVRILAQIFEKQLHFPPHRSDDDNEAIAKAKELLMNRNFMSEAQAHRFIQRRSMDSGMKMAETARLIINSY